MKRMLIGSMLAGLIGLANAALGGGAVDPNALEPCINGQVSASGLYPTQAEEDAALAVARHGAPGTSRQVSSSGR